MQQQDNEFEFRLTTDPEACQCENCTTPANVVVCAKNRSEQMFFCVEHFKNHFPQFRDYLVEIGTENDGLSDFAREQLPSNVHYVVRDRIKRNLDWIKDWFSETSPIHAELTAADCEAADCEAADCEAADRTPEEASAPKEDPLKKRLLSQRSDPVYDRRENPFEGDAILEAKVVDYLSSKHGRQVLDRVHQRLQDRSNYPGSRLPLSKESGKKSLSSIDSERMFNNARKRVLKMFPGKFEYAGEDLEMLDWVEKQKK